jgi:hypothetical protein
MEMAVSRERRPGDVGPQFEDIVRQDVVHSARSSGNSGETAP